MDETGFAHFASIANVAHRARVTTEEAQAGIATLERPDPDSSDPEFEGRRIERVPGGWLVLNAEKHRQLVSRVIVQEQTRERVRKYRNKLKGDGLAEKPRSHHMERDVTHGNGADTGRNPSESETESETESEEKISVRAPRSPHPDVVGEQAQRFDRFWACYPNKKGKDAARKAWAKRHPSEALTELIVAAIARQLSWPEWTRDGGQYIPHPATWLNRGSWDDEPYADTMATYEGARPALGRQSSRLLQAVANIKRESQS